MGEGGFHGYNDANAGHGMWLNDCFGFLSNTLCIGGVGNGADGGHGVILRDSEFKELASTFTGGDGNPDGGDLTLYGDNEVEHLEGEPRSHSVTSPNRYGDTISLTFVGNSGDLVIYSHSFACAGEYMPLAKGTFVIDPSAMFNATIGILPGSGVLELKLTTPSLPGFEGLPIFGQPWFIDLEGANLGTPSCTTLLDPQF